MISISINNNISNIKLTTLVNTTGTISGEVVLTITVCCIPPRLLGILITDDDVGVDDGCDDGCDVGANLYDVEIAPFEALFEIATSSCPELDDAIPVHFCCPAATV